MKRKQWIKVHEGSPAQATPSNPKKGAGPPTPPTGSKLGPSTDTVAAPDLLLRSTSSVVELRPGEQMRAPEPEPEPEPEPKPEPEQAQEQEHEPEPEPERVRVPYTSSAAVYEAVTGSSCSQTVIEWDVTMVADWLRAEVGVPTAADVFEECGITSPGRVCH